MRICVGKAREKDSKTKPRAPPRGASVGNGAGPEAAGWASACTGWERRPLGLEHEEAELINRFVKLSPYQTGAHDPVLDEA
jgi:hypothetical protein